MVGPMQAVSVDRSKTGLLFQHSRPVLHAKEQSLFHFTFIAAIVKTVEIGVDFQRGQSTKEANDSFQLRRLYSAIR